VSAALSIAVIIANRNNGRFLRQCLDSALAQSLRPAEIVVVDDASTDDSVDVLAPYVRDGAVTLVRNAKQAGVAAARDRAIRESRAPWVTTLDADDYYEGRDKLAREADAVGRGGASRIAFSDVLRVDESGAPLGRVSALRRIREGDLSFDIPHLRGFIPRDYLVARDDYLAAGGFNPALNLYEDWDLKIRLSRRCTWHFSGTLGTAYRQTTTGLSRAPRPQHVRAMRDIFSANCQASRGPSRAWAFARFFVYHSVYLRRPAL
jgi:glycosyltransferase involved in cell wall biosynthesis